MWARQKEPNKFYDFFRCETYQILSLILLWSLINTICYKLKIYYDLQGDLNNFDQASFHAHVHRSSSPWKHSRLFWRPSFIHFYLSKMMMTCCLTLSTPPLFFRSMLAKQQQWNKTLVGKNLNKYNSDKW